MAERKVRLGIVGCGGVAQNAHLPAIQRTADIQLVALTDAHADLAQGVAVRYGIDPANAGSDHRALFERPDVDAVSICVHTPHHAPYAIEALRAGKHVLVEKPMAVSADEARAMVEAADAADRILMVGYNHSYDLAGDYVKKMLAEAALGDLLYGEMFFYEDFGAWHAGAYRNLVSSASARIPWPQYSDPFENLREYIHNFNSHTLNLMRLLIGDPQAVEYARWKPGAGMWAMLDYGSYPVFLKNVLTKQRRFEKGVELCGTKKRVRLSLAPPFERCAAGCVEVVDIENQSVSSPLLPYEWPFDREYQHFADCVLNGREPLTCGRHALNDVVLTEELARMATTQA